MVLFVHSRAKSSGRAYPNSATSPMAHRVTIRWIKQASSRVRIRTRLEAIATQVGPHVDKVETKVTDLAINALAVGASNL